MDPGVSWMLEDRVQGPLHLMSDLLWLCGLLSTGSCDVATPRGCQRDVGQTRPDGASWLWDQSHCSASDFRAGGDGAGREPTGSSCGEGTLWGWGSRLGCLGCLEGAGPQSDVARTAWQDVEATCTPFAGGTLLQNGQTTAEIQEEVALTNLGSSSGASKRHSAADKMHFPRSNLQTITTLGMLGHPVLLLNKKLLV